MHLQDWMTKDVVTISGATSLREAIKLIKAREIRHLPVVDRGRLIGIVTETDMLQAFSSLLDDLSISPHLEVTVTGTPGRLQEVSRFFADFPSRVGSFLMARTEPTKPEEATDRTLVLRFQAFDPREILRVLEGAGIRVLSVRHTNG